MTCASVLSAIAATNDMLIRYALNGDTNLDGRVNLHDSNRLPSNSGADNFNLLAINFGRAVAGP